MGDKQDEADRQLEIVHQGGLRHPLLFPQAVSKNDVASSLVYLPLEDKDATYVGDAFWDNTHFII